MPSTGAAQAAETKSLSSGSSLASQVKAEKTETENKVEEPVVEEVLEVREEPIVSSAAVKIEKVKPA